MARKELTDNQEVFVQELLSGKSQREAYKIAYPKNRMSDKTIDEKASRLLNDNGKVRARYENLRKKVQEEAEKKFLITIDEVISELIKIGMIDLRDALVAAGIVKVSDKIKALKLLGLYVGAFNSDINLNIKTSEKLNDVIEQLGGKGLTE